MLRAAVSPWVVPPGPNAPATVTESPFLMSDTLGAGGLVDRRVGVELDRRRAVRPFEGDRVRADRRDRLAAEAAAAEAPGLAGLASCLAAVLVADPAQEEAAARPGGAPLASGVPAGVAAAVAVSPHGSVPFCACWTASASVAGPLSPAIALPAKNAPAISASTTTAAIDRAAPSSSPRRSRTPPRGCLQPLCLLVYPPPGAAPKPPSAAAPALLAVARIVLATTVPLDAVSPWTITVSPGWIARRLGLGRARDAPALGELDLDRRAARVVDVERRAVDARHLADRRAATRLALAAGAWSGTRAPPGRGPRRRSRPRALPRTSRRELPPLSPRDFCTWTPPKKPAAAIATATAATPAGVTSRRRSRRGSSSSRSSMSVVIVIRTSGRRSGACARRGPLGRCRRTGRPAPRRRRPGRPSRGRSRARRRRS